MPLPAARQTPTTWRTSDLKRSNSRHQVSLTSETTRANPNSGKWNYGLDISGNFAEIGDFHVSFGFFTCRKFTTWDRRLYFPSEGRGTEDYFVRKIRRLRPCLNLRTWVPKASTLTSGPPKPLKVTWYEVKYDFLSFPFCFLSLPPSLCLSLSLSLSGPNS